MVSCNHTKTHKLLSYTFPVMIDLNRLVYSRVSVFFHCVIDSLVLKLNNSFVIIPSWYSMISYIFHSVSKNCIINQKILKTSFLQWCFTFFLCLSSYQCVVLTWLKLMTMDYCKYFDMYKLWKITLSVITFLVWMFVS